MPTVTNTTPCVREFPFGVRLEPGANDVPDDVWERCAAVAYIQSLLRHGVVLVSSTPKATQVFHPETQAAAALAGPALRKLKPADALKAVEACASPDVLTSWLDHEGRAKIREAIVRRAYALAPPEAEGVGRFDPSTVKAE